MRKRILITGGLGYLGGRIAVELAENSDAIVRLGTRKQALQQPWLPQAEVVTMNMLDSSSLQEAVNDVQVVVHMAAMNEHACLANPSDAILVNVKGTYDLLRAAVEAGVERFVYFSTAHVYGSPLVGSISEVTLPKPVHPYAITHHAAEGFVLAAHHKKELDGLVIRLSNGFGAPTHADVDRWTLLVNDLSCQAVYTGKIVLQSHGLQRRDFITLEDVGRAVNHVLKFTREQCSDGLFNLGGGMSLSIWEMTERIAKRCQIVLGLSPEIIRPIMLDNERVSGKPFIYESNKIKQTGFRLEKQVDAAIDETLRLLGKEHARATEKDA
jgi:UDP-glucose 4-epimerase